MDSSECAFGYAGFGLGGVSQKLPANNYKRFSGRANRNASKKNCSVPVLSSKIRVPKIECREWSFILIPDRYMRLDCQRCCFRSCINAYSFTTLKFMPPVVFSKPLYDLPLWCLRAPTSRKARIAQNRRQIVHFQNQFQCLEIANTSLQIIF